MKIPETQSNVGAYYGNEENGQWQPNGVIIDTGVGGGVVGSGDAGIHRPPAGYHPVHVHRGHIPGYVMAGAYYPPAYPPAAAPPPDDFADYMWMENEEEFDKQVMQQLEEEALMEQCIEAMLEDEQRERQRPVANGHARYPTTSNGGSISLEEAVSRSTLNPLAAEFVPTRSFTAPTAADKSQDSTDSAEVKKEVSPVVSAEHTLSDTTEESSPQDKDDTPEVSAADVQPIDKDKRPKDKKDASKAKAEPKKPVKQEIKAKGKPQVVKSETKVQPKKKEVKIVKSEVKVDDVNLKPEESPVVEVIKQEPSAPSPVEEPTGPKPINYAAAAKANKPKKPTTPPALDKSTPPPTLKPTEKIDKKLKDKPLKTEKPVPQRKSSTK